MSLSVAFRVLLCVSKTSRNDTIQFDFNRILIHQDLFNKIINNKYLDMERLKGVNSKGILRGQNA